MQALIAPSLVKNVVIVLVVLVVAYAIIALGMRIFNSGGANTSRAHMVPLSKKIAAADPKQAVVAGPTAISPWQQGGEFTISCWFAVSDWNVSTGKYRHLFSLSNANTVVMYALLDMELPTIILRVCTSTDQTYLATHTDFTTTGFNGMLLQDLPSQPGHIDRTLVGVTPCDVGDVDLQRWMNLTVAVRGRLVDVYLDGKLARNCVLENLPAVDPTNMQLNIGATAQVGTAAASVSGKTGVTSLPSFGGYLSNLQTWNKSLAPESIADLYGAGPDANTGGWLSSWLHTFNVTVTVSDQAGDNSYTLKL